MRSLLANSLNSVSCCRHIATIGGGMWSSIVASCSGVICSRIRPSTSHILSPEKLRSA